MMGFLRYLQRTLASFLRPWIMQKDLLEPLLLHIHLSRVVLELQSFELDCAFINSSLLSSSPFLLRHACLDHAKLTISFFRSPGVSLNIRGLHFVCHIRPPEDSFWGDREAQLAEALKKEAIATLDPSGASVHLAADRHTREGPTSSKLKAFMASLVLQALRVELYDASSELHPNSSDHCNSMYSLILESLVLEEGYGLAGAFLRRLTNILKEADYFLCKTCSVQKLGLQFSTSEESLGQVKSTHVIDTLERPKFNKHPGKNYVLLWKTVTLLTGFQNDKLIGIDALFAETVIQFSLAEAEAFIIAINQLQGVSRASHTAVHSEKTHHPRKVARYLWQRAFEKITGGSWRKFKNAVEAGLLRQRYSQLYASWLAKAGEGMFNEIGLQSYRKFFQRKKGELHSLERDLSRLEQEMPIEAIVLARFLGRNKALTDSNKLVLTAQPMGFVAWGKAILCLFAFWEALMKVYKTLAGLLKGFFNILYTLFRKFFLTFGFQWIFLKCMKGVSYLQWRLSVLTIPSSSGTARPHLTAVSSEVLDKSNFFKSKNMKGRMCFNSTFIMGSVTFIGSTECLSRNHARNLLRGSWINLLEGENLPGVHFSFGNVSLIYSSKATTLGLELVFGYLQGQVVTIPVRRLDTDTDAESQKCVIFIEKEEAMFLQSGPAPQISLPASVKDQFESSDSRLSHEASFLDFLGREMVLTSPSERAHESNGRPFIICSYENTQTSQGRDVDMWMCSLAVGCVNCKFNLETYGLLGLLLVQLLNTVRIDKKPTNDEISQSKLASSMIILTGNDWEILYADQLRQSISTVVFKREIWLSTALAGPKLEFSGCFVSSTSATKTGDGAVPFEPILLIDLGLLEVTIWPAMVKQDKLHAEKGDGALKQPFCSARKKKLWLRKLPSPNIQGDEVVKSSFEHEEIGNNGIVSLHGAVISLRALHGSETNKLLRPINMLLKFSFCRNYFISPSGVCNIVSAAVLGSLSPIQLEILHEELELLFEAFKIISTTTREFLALKETYSEASRWEEEQKLRHGDDGFSVRGNSVSFRQTLFFAASLEIKVDEFGFVLSDKKLSEGAAEQKTSKRSSHPTDPHVESLGCLECLSMHKRMDQISMRNLWLHFSWGDGCILLLSCGFDEVSLLIVKKLLEGSRNSIQSGNVSSTWKSKKTVLKANEDNGHEDGKCQLLVKQATFRIRRPWSLSDMETLKSTLFRKHQVFVHNDKDCWMNVEIEMERLHMNVWESNNLISKAFSRVDGASHHTIDIAISNDYKSVSVIMKGGMLFLHTKALLILLQELRSISSSKKVSMETNTGDSAFTSFSNNRSKDEGVVYQSSLGKSLSLPSRQPQDRHFNQERLYSAPFESRIIDVQEAAAAGSESRLWFPEVFSMEVRCLCFFLAQTKITSMGEEQGGLLLEMGGNFKLQTSATRKTLCLETKKICVSILSEGKDLGGMMGQLSQIPRFGSGSTLHAGSGVGNDIEKSTLLLSDTPLLIDGGMATQSRHLVSEEGEKNLSKGLSMERENNYILENLSISSKLENNSGYLGPSNGWSGSCAFLGLDIGITVPEIQLVLALISSISSLPRPLVKDESRALRDSNVTPSKQISDHTFEVPDGSIVALKDVQEHLYLAVENTKNNSYHLIGVLHHSLVGDRALFKVKYQKNSRDTSPAWFSLLSVAAKSGNGEAFRVHYRPGSGLADISSTHDGSWELWQARPYKYSSKEGEGDIDLYSDLTSNFVHLVNQKSKQGLTLATGGPVMVKQPGNPFKFKVLQSGLRNKPLAQLEMQTLSTSAHDSKDYPSYAVATIPQVELKVGRVAFTLLHESGGGKYLLPLLRGCLEDTEAVMHVQAHKIRVIGGCKFVFEYLEAHLNEWSSIIQPVNIGLFYRFRIGEERSNDRVKLPVSFFARCKRVDISISEKSLDIMLFVIGILKLAGPYNIKHSPILASSCLVENHTGLDLCCNYDSQEHTEILKVPAWRTATFFVRNLMSRRDSWPAKMLSSITFNLEKEGVGLSSPVPTSLVEPSLMAVRTCLERKDGHKRTAGPIIVVEVSKQSQDGIIVIVSPMTRIHNCSGLALELRCRRPKGDTQGASVFLKDGDIVDDSMGAFDALNLEGELQKALSSFSLGEYLLAVRPVRPVPVPSLANDENAECEFDWSEDIKGAKPIHISGFFEKLQYGFKKSLKGRNASHSFGIVFCALNAKNDDKENVSKSSKGMHILIRITSRYVPLQSINSNNKPDASRPIAAWQEQKELVLLPTLCVHNFLDLRISISSRAGAGKSPSNYYTSIEQGCKVSLYADLADLVFSVCLDELNLASKDISIGEWSRSVERSTAPSDYVKELEVDLDFGDNNWCARLKILRANDGVLQVLVYSQYAVKNTSDITLLFCMPKQSGYFWALWNKGGKVKWPSGEAGTVLNPGAKISLLKRSQYILLRMAEKLSETANLDLESFSGSTELSLKICREDGLTEETQLGVKMEITQTGSINPTRTINIGSRYILFNDSHEAIFICLDGLQEDENAAALLKAGEHISLKTQYYPGSKQRSVGYSQLSGSGIANSSICSVRFRFQENDWDWTGPVCASSLGSFSLRIHKRSDTLLNVPDKVETKNEAMFKFISVDVEDESPSLVIRFRIQSADAVPYRIENALSQASIFFYQKGLNDIVTTLEPGQVVGYGWDDLSQPHKLVVGVSGTQLHNEIKLDKLRPWKSFQALRQKKVFGLQLPFENQLDTNLPSGTTSGELSLPLDSIRVGYEIGAYGFQRVLRICEDLVSSKLTKWQSHISFPSARMDFRFPVFGITLVENLKHQKETGATRETSEDIYRISPIISMRMGNLFLEILNTQKHLLFQLKVETLNVDERWEGAPFAAMLRVHSEDRFKKGETVLHMAAIVSNQASNPIHVKYSSILLQTIDVNLDEETLMKLVPFYRYSLAESTSSRQIYFERLEIHPVKIVASFIPGQPLADYTSAQEAFRTLLHSFIKVPSIRGSTVELNGVLLTHALMTFRQLAIKCAQHYSWYAMRAVYIAKGSKLLPPAFTSLFDDSAASSLDVFFDPSNGSIDLQGLTLGMFNFLSDGLGNRGFSGTSRYIGDLERTMKTAGSNILFAILTEVSDNVLKGAETGGLDGMVNGFRRGILNVSMEPSLLQTAVVKGGSSRRIKLDHSAGIDEMYVEGYLQAMLDTIYQQNYLKVKVVDDQVLLKNLPPNSTLVDEIMGSVKNFLVREGLLAGETSTAAMHSWRRLQGENDKRIVPAVAALSEQLFVIFAVRALRNRARSWFHWGLNSSRVTSSSLGHFIKKETDGKGQTDTEGGQEKSRGMKGILFSFVMSSAMAYIDGRLCRHIPNTLARRVVSGFLLSFVE